jgi:hypothetical protein
MAEPTIKRVVCSSIYTKDDKFGILIHWSTGEVMVDSGPMFDTVDAAKTAGTEILERMLTKLQEQGFNAYRPGAG